MVGSGPEWTRLGNLLNSDGDTYTHILLWLNELNQSDLLDVIKNTDTKYKSDTNASRKSSVSEWTRPLGLANAPSLCFFSCITSINLSCSVRLRLLLDGDDDDDDDGDDDGDKYDSHFDCLSYTETVLKEHGIE